MSSPAARVQHYLQTVTGRQRELRAVRHLAALSLDDSADALEEALEAARVACRKQALALAQGASSERSWRSSRALR